MTKTIYSTNKDVYHALADIPGIREFVRSRLILPDVYREMDHDETPRDFGRGRPSYFDGTHIFYPYHNPSNSTEGSGSEFLPSYGRAIGIKWDKRRFGRLKRPLSSHVKEGIEDRIGVSPVLRIDKFKCRVKLGSHPASLTYAEKIGEYSPEEGPILFPPYSFDKPPISWSTRIWGTDNNPSGMKNRLERYHKEKGIDKMDIIMPFSIVIDDGY